MAEEVVRKPLEAIDLNDLSLATEELGADFDPSADGFAFPPPPDDGTHLVKLGYGQDAWKKGVSKTGKSYLMAHLQLTPVTEKGWTLFDRPSTMVMASGTSRVAGIILAVTGKPAQARDIVGLAKELDGLVRGERVVKVETVWEASCNHGVDGGKYEVIKRGQAKFKRTAHGYDPQIECPKCGAMVGAQARVVKYTGAGEQAVVDSVSVSTGEANPFA